MIIVNVGTAIKRSEKSSNIINMAKSKVSISFATVNQYSIFSTLRIPVNLTIKNVVAKTLAIIKINFNKDRITSPYGYTIFIVIKLSSSESVNFALANFGGPKLNFASLEKPSPSEGIMPVQFLLTSPVQSSS